MNDKERAAFAEMLAALRHAAEAMLWHDAEEFELNGKTAGAFVRLAIAKAEAVQP